MSNFENLRIEQDDRGVAILTLCRAEKHNAFNAALIAELRQAADHLASDASVRVVVLAGEGKSFCAGGDLGWMQEQAAKDRAGKIAETSELAYMLRDLDELPKPLIGRVHGSAYGGGIGMMAVCDIVIAADTARFALTETKLGLIPATIGPYVVRRLGEGAARRVFMNARPFDAGEAKQLGLVSTITPLEEIDEAVERECNWFLKCAPGAVADAKDLCLHLARNPQQDHVAYSAGKLADRWETDEAKDGISDFFSAKRA